MTAPNEYPIVLTAYERDNLLSILRFVLSGDPIGNALHTGDWTAQVAYKLGMSWDPKLIDHGAPNLTDADLRQRVKLAVDAAVRRVLLDGSERES